MVIYDCPYCDDFHAIISDRKPELELQLRQIAFDKLMHHIRGKHGEMPRDITEIRERLKEYKDMRNDIPGNQAVDGWYNALRWVLMEGDD